jgi:AFG3 family protein
VFYYHFKLLNLGGRAAERIFFDSVTTGAADDLDKVTKMAYAMVTQFGFSEKIGQVNFSNMGDGMNKPYSEQTGKDIDDEVRRIIDEQWER